ncbi:S49 family peptidase [Vibrio cholerae]|nr:S49 family peptidase [Vibrio cholerae]
MPQPINELITQLSQQPVLISAAHINTLTEAICMSARAQSQSVQEKPKLSAEAYAMATGYTANGKYRPYEVIQGIAIIAVTGTLLARYDWSDSYATGYPVIQRKLQAARKDPMVQGIFMDYSTFGGAVNGCADTGDLIHEIGKEKPIAGHANEFALSAGLWLFSQCTHRYVTQSAAVGSLGVVIAHFSFQKMLENFGVKVTLLFDGEHKVDGNPYETLKPEVQARLQAELVETRAQFAAAVARGTGMSVEAALATEALSYKGQKAIEIGFAQKIVSGQQAITAFSQTINSARKPMLINQANGQAVTEGEQGAIVTAPAATVPAATAPNAIDERARISAILTHADAQGRAELANHLAFNTNLSADEAAGILAKAPKEGAQQTPAEGQQLQTPAKKDASLLSKAMAKEQVPEVSADDEGVETPDANSAASILATSFKHLGIEDK